MEGNEMLTQIQEICRDVFNDSSLQISPLTNAGDIESWDSMTNLFLIDKLEKRFEMKFSLDDILNAENIGQLMDAIKAQQSRASNR